MTSDIIKLPKLHSGQQAIYKGLGELTVIRCGRRFGKTTLLETAAANWAIKGEKIGWFCPNYKLLLPSYKRILRLIKPVVANSSKVDSIIELETDGLVEFWTLGDEDAGRSRSYDRVIIDEAGLVKKGLKEIWEQAIALTLLDRDGSAIMAGTPKGIDPDNFFYTACTDKSLGWKEFHAPTSANPHLSAERVARMKDERPPLVYQQEVLAEFVDWSGAHFFNQEDILVNGLPVPYPTHCDAVMAVIDTAVKTGSKNDGTAVSFYAISKYSGHRLVILDWDIVQIEGSLLESWLPSIFTRLEELARATGARMGSIGTFIEDMQSGSILLQQGKRHGWAVHAIDSKLTSVGKDERAISVSGYVFQGMAKISEHAYNKTKNYKGQERNHFLSQVMGFQIGIKEQADDLLDTFTYALSLTLGNADGY